MGTLVYATMETGNVEGFSKSYLEADYQILRTLLKSVPGDVELEYQTGGYEYRDGKFYTGAFGRTYSIEVIKENRG